MTTASAPVEATHRKTKKCSPSWLWPYIFLCIKIITNNEHIWLTTDWNKSWNKFWATQSSESFLGVNSWGRWGISVLPRLLSLVAECSRQKSGYPKSLLRWIVECGFLFLTTWSVDRISARKSPTDTVRWGRLSSVTKNLTIFYVCVVSQTSDLALTWCQRLIGTMARNANAMTVWRWD